MDRDAQRARRWGGDSAQSAPASPGRNHCWFMLGYRVARQPPGALAERSGSERIAGCSGGASGPCRPGLKPYRKSSPTVAAVEMILWQLATPRGTMR